MKKRADGRYQDQITINKKRIYFYGKTELEVKRKIAAYEAEKERGRLFSAVADEWAAIHQERIMPNSWMVYIAPLRRVKEVYTGYIKDIKPGQIQAYITSLGKQQYARRTVQVYLDMLRMIFDFAVIEGDIDANPCLSVHLPSGLKKKTRELPDDSTIEIIKQSVDRPFGLFPFMLIYTGLRRGELLALRYEDIDFNTNTINVTKSVHYQPNQPLIKATKTATSFRKVILLDVLSDKLDAKGKGYIFGGDKPLTKSEFRRRWKNWCIDVGLVKTEVKKLKNKRGKEYERKEYKTTLEPHQLRHYYATVLYEAGIQDKDAQKLLGHSNIQTTRDIYTHIRDSRQSETANKLNKFIKGDV